MAEDKKATFSAPHNVIMEDRHRLSVSGVSDVDSFDEQTVVLFTDLGELTVKGGDLHISQFSIDSGDLIIEGKIASLVYTETAPKASGFFGRVFR
ncbi:MAG: sporulation protein YabP [Clostridiales bacterium]|jgi:sporulation protein YabP|nr:sporulation protein YabP [Clostridiales bacterium]